MSRIQSKLAELKAQGRSIIHMEFGQPSTGAPRARWPRRCPSQLGPFSHFHQPEEPRRLS